MILERVYLFLFGFLFLDAFYRTTMFPQTFVVNQWLPTLTLLALAFLKLLLYGRETPLQSVLVGVLALGFLLIYKTTRDINLPIMAYLVIGAYGVSFRKIVRVYCGIGIPLLVFCITASQMGLVSDLVYDMTWAGRGLRHSFGIIYPTDFAAHVTYLVLGWGWFRSSKLTWMELGVIVFSTWAVYHFCNGRTSFLCLVVFILLCVSIKLYKLFAHLYSLRSSLLKRLSVAGKVIQILSGHAISLLSLWMILLTFGYSESTFMFNLDETFRLRLMYGKQAIDQYGIKLLGQEVVMQGAGYSETSPLGYYFYIDCSYIKMLVCYGLVVSIFIWIAYTLLGHRAIKANDIYLIWVIGVIGLHCAMEHHLMEIAYNPFLLAVFSKWDEVCALPEKKSTTKPTGLPHCHQSPNFRAFLSSNFRGLIRVLSSLPEKGCWFSSRKLFNFLGGWFSS